MNRSCLILTFVLLAQTYAFAQTTKSEAEIEKARKDEAAAALQQIQIQNQNEAAIRLKSQADLRDFLSDKGSSRKLEPGASADLEAKFLEFRMAIPKFRVATEEYGMNLGLNVKLDKSLKNIETQADVLLRYLNAAKVNHPRADPKEFKDFSQSELAWETLNTAEHIASVLNLAVVVERRSVVSTETINFLYTLDGQLLRLKWLTSHTK